MEIPGEVVADLGRLLHPVACSHLRLGRTVHDADQGGLLDRLPVGDERLHDQAQQVRTVSVLLLDHLLVVVFDQAVDPHGRIIRPEFEDEERTVAAVAGMKACELARQRLTAELERLLPASHAFQLQLRLRRCIEREYRRHVSVADPLDEEVGVLHNARGLLDEGLTADDVQNHALDAETRYFLIPDECQAILPNVPSRSVVEGVRRSKRAGHPDRR